MVPKALRCVTFLCFGLCAAYAQSSIRLNEAIIPLGTTVKRAAADAEVFRLDDGLSSGNQLRALQSVQTLAISGNKSNPNLTEDYNATSFETPRLNEVLVEGSHISRGTAATEHRTELIAKSIPAVATTSPVSLDANKKLTKPSTEIATDALPKATPITRVTTRPENDKNEKKISRPQSPVRQLLFENILGLFQNPKGNQGVLPRVLNHPGTNKGILGAVSNTIDQLPIIGSSNNGSPLLEGGIIKNSIANARDAVSNIAGSLVGPTAQGGLVQGAIERVLEMPAAAGSIITGNRGIV